MVYESTMRKMRFDEEGSEVLPAKNRPFKLKARMPTPKAPSVPGDGKVVKSDPLKGILPSESSGPKIANGTKGVLEGRSITDATGLSRAYEQGDTYAYGDTLYVAGSHTAKDWYDDVTKVPFCSDLRNSTRYQEAEKALKAHSNIENNLSESVALELQKNHPSLNSRTFGAPVWDPMSVDNKYTGFNGQVDRCRNAVDPFSVFDGSAKTSIKWNHFNSYSFTHDYSNIAQNFKTGGNDKAYGWQNADGTTSITQ